MTLTEELGCRISERLMSSQTNDLFLNGLDHGVRMQDSHFFMTLTEWSGCKVSDQLMLCPIGVSLPLTLTKGLGCNVNDQLTLCPKGDPFP